MSSARTKFALLVGMLCSVLAVVTVASAKQDGSSPGHQRHGGFEVWTIDQQDSRPLHGGTLHIFDGKGLTDGTPQDAQRETIDLGAAASDLCQTRTGTRPRRPHMLVFNGAEDLRATDAVVAWVATGHILFMDAVTRQPVDCIDVGVQAHAAWPTPDQRYLIVADQNGKKLHRIRTDYAANQFAMEPGATLDLAVGTTPNGVPKEGPHRPDNAPICPRTDNADRVTFVTLRGGGMFVVDHHQTPMQIVGEYDNSQVDDNGCGEFEARGDMYVNSGAGAPGEPNGHDVYKFPISAFDSTPNPPNTPAAKLVYTRDHEGVVDAHAVSNSKGGDKYLWWGDRAQNDVTVLETKKDRIVDRFSLVSEHCSDPAPDLFDLAPDAKHMFASLRGPAPATGGHDAIGNCPGVGVIDVTRGGKSGEMNGVAPVPPGAEGLPPDPHAIRLRLR